MMCGDQENKVVSRDGVPNDKKPATQEEVCCPNASKSTEQHNVLSEKEQPDCVPDPEKNSNVTNLSSGEEKESELSETKNVKLVDCMTERSKQDTSDNSETQNVCESVNSPNPPLHIEATLPNAQKSQNTASIEEDDSSENLGNRIEETVVVTSAVSSTFECELAEKVNECVADTITKVCNDSIQTDDKFSVVNIDRHCDIVVKAEENVKEDLLCADSIERSLLDSVDSIIDRPCDIFVNKPAEDLHVSEDDTCSSSSNNGLLTTPSESTLKTDECTQTDLKLPIVEESLADNAQDEATDTAINSSFSPSDSTASEQYCVAINKTESVHVECTAACASNTNDGNNEEHQQSDTTSENNGSNKCVSITDTVVKPNILQCVSKTCDVVQSVSSVVDEANSTANPQVFPEIKLAKPPVAKSMTVRSIFKPPKRATGRRRKRRRQSKSEIPPALPTPLPPLLPSKSGRPKAPVPKVVNHSNSVSMDVPDQGVLDLTTKPKKSEVERVKPITRLSNRGLSQVFGQLAFPEDRSDFVLKVPSVRHPSSLPLEFIAPSLEPTPTLSVPKKKNCVRVQSPTQADKYVFQIEDYHHTLTPKGQKIYTCEICSGVYQRSFSLKRHYLRSHINYKHLTARDISNCGIVVGDKMSIQSGSKQTVIKPTANHEADSGTEIGDAEPRASLPDLYRCHTCGLCFDYKQLLKKHLENHPLADPSILSKPYSCIHCPAQFTHQHNYKKHQSFHSHLTSNTPFSPSSSAVAYPCSYCYKAFPSQAVRKKHIQQHKEASSHACMFLCGESFPELQLLRQHLLTTHGREYLGCPKCEERFLERSILEEHKLFHHRQEMEQPSISITVEVSNKKEVAVQSTSETSVNHAESIADVEVKPPPIVPQTQEQQAEPASSKSDSGEFRYTCTVCNKMFTNYVNMCRHRRLAHGTIGKHTKPQKNSETSDECPSPQTDVESSKQTECESAVPPPVLQKPEKQDDSPSVDESSATQVACKVANKLLNYLDDNLQAGPSCRDLDVGRTVSLTSELTITALPMEKPKKIRDNCEDSTDYSSEDDSATSITPAQRLGWGKYSFPKSYKMSVNVLEMADLSYLDINTQMAMHSRIPYKAVDNECGKEKELTQASFLWQGAGLVEAPVQPVEETKPPEPVCEDQEESILSGEWIRPRSYICCTCADKFSDLWQLEDHMFTAHHNVWWTFLELDASTPVPSDLFHRMLDPVGALCSAEQGSSNATDWDCTKCGRTSYSPAELHRHMLECGGDASWLSSPTRRKSKWKPFGSRRRRQQGRRGMKRNIPSSPVKLLRGRPRGDCASDTIQRMIANLPAKRTTRRVIQFTEDEIKTRSQATIHNPCYPGFPLTYPRLPKKPMKLLSIEHKRRGRPKLDSTQKKPESELPSEISTASKSPHKKSSSDKEASGVKVLKKKKHSIMNEPIAGNSKGRIGKEEDSQSQQLFPSVPPFICNGCGAEFVASSAGERHAKKCVYRHLFQLDSDTPKASNSCTHCNKSFDLPTSLEKHMKNCAKLVTVKSENVCHHCNKSFVFATALEKHTKNCPKLPDDLDMPTLQKEEPLKVHRTKKTLSNIPVLSPVNQAPKIKVTNVKKQTTTRRKCMLPDDNPVETDSKLNSCKIEKLSPVPDEALPPNVPHVEVKTAPEKKVNQKTKPVVKKIRKKFVKVAISKVNKSSKAKNVKLSATEAPNPMPVPVGKKIPLPKLERKTKKVLNGRANNKTKTCNSNKISAPEVAESIVKSEPVDVRTIQSKVKAAAKTKAKRQTVVKETEVINKTNIDSISVEKEAVSVPKSKKKSKDKGGKSGVKMASIPAVEKTSKFQSNGVLQDHDDNKMSKVTKRKYKMKSKVNAVVADLNVTVNEIKAPASKVPLAKKPKVVAKPHNKFAVKLEKPGKKNPVKKQMKRKMKGDDIGKKRIKLSPESPTLSTNAPAEQQQPPAHIPMETTSLNVAIKQEQMCEEQKPDVTTQTNADDSPNIAEPSVAASLEPAPIDAATTSTKVEESALPATEPDPLPKVDSNPIQSTSEPAAAPTSDCLWCEVCNKTYSSAFNLMKHRGSLKHKRNAEAVNVPTKETQCEGGEGSLEHKQNADIPTKETQCEGGEGSLEHKQNAEAVNIPTKETQCEGGEGSLEHKQNADIPTKETQCEDDEGFEGSLKHKQNADIPTKETQCENDEGSLKHNQNAEAADISTKETQCEDDKGSLKHNQNAEAADIPTKETQCKNDEGSLKHKQNADIPTKETKCEDDAAQEVLNSTAEQLDLYINCPASEDVDAKIEFDSNFVVPPAPPPSPVDFALQEAAKQVSKGTKRGRGKRRFSRKKKQHKGDSSVSVESAAAMIAIKSEVNMDLDEPPSLSPNNCYEETSNDDSELAPPLADPESIVESAQPVSPVAVLIEEKGQPGQVEEGTIESITLVKTSDLLKKEEQDIMESVKRSNSLAEDEMPEEVPDVADEALENAESALKATSQCAVVVSSDINDLEVPPVSLENPNPEAAVKVNTPPTSPSSIATKTEPVVSSVTCGEFGDTFSYGWSANAASLPSEQAAPSSENSWNYPNWNGWAPGSEWSGSYYPPPSSSVPPTTTEPSQPTTNPSFGAILGSVHQVLEDGASEYASSEYSVSGQAAPDCPNPYLMDPFDGRQSFEEIQKAMGATDEEMAMLQQFGQGSLGSHEFVYDNNSTNQAGFPEGEALQPLDNPDLIDLDNQASNPAYTEPPDSQLSSNLLLDEGGDVGRYISQFDGADGLPPSIIPTTKLLAVYEKKEMVCPMCNRHFLGLQALETHISWVHKVKDTKSRIFQKKEASSARDGWCATGYSSLLAREPGCLVGSAAGVVLGSAGGIRGGVLRAAAGAAAEAAESSSTKKRKLACFVCKELYSDVIALNRHIAQLHLKKKGDTDKDGGLKSQMSSALGGLLDRALNNMLGKAGKNSNQNLREVSKLVLGGERAEEAEEETPHEEPAAPPTMFKKEPVAEEQDDSAMETSEDSSPSFDTLPTAFLPEQSYICQHCGTRFTTESSRDEHVTEVHDAAAIQLPGGCCKVETSEREQADDPPLPTYALPEQNIIPTPEQLAFSQSIERTVPEPPSDELQCPVCLAAMKHYHSLCRHLKTQHCEWSIQAFSTDMYNYLIIKRDSPPELIRKKYSISIPAPRGSTLASTSTSKSDTDAEAEAAGRRPSQPCSNSSGNNSDSGICTPRQALELEADHDSIRAKAFAALRQLNQRHSRYGGVQSVPIRGSKRRPLDVYEFFEDDEMETPPLRLSSTPRQERKSIDLNEEETEEATDSVGIDLPTEGETEDIYGTYECNTCSKSFKSLKAYCKHSQDVCKSMYSYDSSSDDNDLDNIRFTGKEENTTASIDTATDNKSAPTCDSKMDSGLQLICN